VHTWLRNRRTQAGPTHRIVYSTCADVLACLAAAAVFQSISSTGTPDLGAAWSTVGVVLAMATYWLANTALIWAVVYLVRQPERLRDLFSTPDEELYEVATMSLGAMLAITLAHAPVLCPLVLVLMIVLRRSALVRQLQEQATRDARTGLLNAGAWRQEAEQELARSARGGGDISLLMIDLDHFKALNDAYGHPAGDRALKAVAECLTDTLRGYDAVGRYGGEEFSALLVDADELTGEAVAERVCAKIREIELPDGVTVTASIGVATAPAARTDLEALITRADAALYVAKNHGRDRVRAAQRVAARIAG
jgi:diguanylate cyclase (GGDEF)-like protein